MICRVDPVGARTFLQMGLQVFEDLVVDELGVLLKLTLQHQISELEVGLRVVEELFHRADHTPIEAKV